MRSRYPELYPRIPTDIVIQSRKFRRDGKRTNLCWYDDNLPRAAKVIIAVRAENREQTLFACDGWAAVDQPQWTRKRNTEINALYPFYWELDHRYLNPESSMTVDIIQYLEQS